MLRHCLILLLTLRAGWAVPQASSDVELQRLARLPKVEFAAPLQFDRVVGFVVFPDSTTATSEALKLLKEAKLVPGDAPKYLEASRWLQAQGETTQALRAMGRAADLLRQRVEGRSGSAVDLARLAEALGAIGKGDEAQARLEEARSLAPDDGEVLAIAARVYQERAWQAVAGAGKIFTSETYLDSLGELLGDPPASGTIAKAGEFLEMAEGALGKVTNRTEEVHLQRAAFQSFRGSLEEALTQTREDETRLERVRKKLFNAAAMEELWEAAALSENPAVIAAAAFTRVLAEGTSATVEQAWREVSAEVQRRVLQDSARLETMVVDGGERAAEAAEYLGAIQLFILRDYRGSQRSLREAVRRETRRHRAWELLVLAAWMEGNANHFLETCQDRFNAMATGRSAVFLAKAFDRNGDGMRAELICMAGLAALPADFHLNLSLAGLLLKRENARDSLWRVRELITRAEKAVATGTAQNQLDLALTKSIFLGLSDKTTEARAVLSPFAAVSPEVEEVLRVLER